MTITYQPSAAGISWLVLAQTLDSRTQMEEDLLKLSAENSKVQVDLTKSTSDQAQIELLAQANGQKQNAIFTMSGAGAGIVAAFGTSVGSIATMPKGEQAETNTSIGLQKVENSPIPVSDNSVEMKEMTVKINAANSEPIPAQPAPAQSQPAASNTKGVPTSGPTRATLNKFFTDNGNLFSQSLSTGIKSFGDLQQAAYTEQQAEAKKFETLAQGLATVMNAQGQMLSSTISSCDSFFNNLEGSFTTIIQVSAVRG